MDPLPSLDALRVLAACVRHGSFSRAAAALFVTPSAVSARIRSLEDELGVTLFERKGPKLEATERAVQLASKVDDALDSIRSAIDGCRRMTRPVRITCAPSFARWLVPHLAQYQALAGAEKITLDAAPALVPSEGFDVAIRSGRGPWPCLSAAPLLAERGTPMLSPKLVRVLRAARVRSARGLLTIPLIPDGRWPRWFEAAGVRNAKPTFIPTRFASYELEAAAAVQGLGAALLSPVLYQDLLRDGALVAPFTAAVEGPESYWALWRQGAPPPHFVRWLQELVAAPHAGA